MIESRLPIHQHNTRPRVALEMLWSFKRHHKAYRGENQCQCNPGERVIYIYVFDPIVLSIAEPLFIDDFLENGVTIKALVSTRGPLLMGEKMSTQKRDNVTTHCISKRELGFEVTSQLHILFENRRLSAGYKPIHSFEMMRDLRLHLTAKM